MGKQIRQGDLLLERIKLGKQKVVAKGVSQNVIRATVGDRIVLLEGEKTGHAHAIESDAGDFSVWEGEMRVLDVKNGATLVHEEHHAQPLAPGAYQVTAQREYRPADLPAEPRKLWD